MLIESAKELKHPGFIVFEGLDFTGKTFLAKKSVKEISIDPRFKLEIKYNHNHGFLNQGLVNENLLKSLNPTDRIDYLIDCYSKDVLPKNPREFSEIFQDRHIPYLIYYSIIKTGVKLEEILSRVKEFNLPKHIFLIECNYKERCRRALKKSKIKLEEKETISSEKAHKKHQELYRQIIQDLEIPYTIINTSYLENKKVTKYFLNILKKSNIVSHEISLDRVVVDHEYDIFESTFKYKLEQILRGKNLEPIPVLRKIDKSLGYIDLLLDGRHRAYSYWKAGKKTIPSYINYQAVENIDTATLKKLSEFKFREGDTGQIIKGKLVY